MCSNIKGSSDTSTDTFKIVVYVVNQLPNDLTGSITVSTDHQLESILRHTYGFYFPGAGEMISKIFTFKFRDESIGTGFEVNLEYGDGKNQYKFGKTSLEKRDEIISFNIGRIN